jgi:hypothetical protein
LLPLSAILRSILASCLPPLTTFSAHPEFAISIKLIWPVVNQILIFEEAMIRLDELELFIE